MGVKADPAYAHPAYPYQRAGYQFYNVTYAENMAYVDPFRPELGRATGREMLGRIVENVRAMPMTLGEGVSVHRGWWRGEVEKINLRVPAARIPMWVADVAMLALCVPVVAGFVLLVLQGQWLLVLYAVGSLFMIAVTPWPGQFVRYLVPLTPFLTLALVTLLAWAARHAARDPDGRLARSARSAARSRRAHRRPAGPHDGQVDRQASGAGGRHRSGRQAPRVPAVLLRPKLAAVRQGARLARPAGQARERSWPRRPRTGPTSGPVSGP